MTKLFRYAREGYSTNRTKSLDAGLSLTLNDGKSRHPQEVLCRAGCAMCLQVGRGFIFDFVAQQQCLKSNAKSYRKPGREHSKEVMCKPLVRLEKSLVATFWVICRRAGRYVKGRPCQGLGCSSPVLR